MAEAIQILLSHALGDAISPYVIGAVSKVFVYFAFSNFNCFPVINLYLI